MLTMAAGDFGIRMQTRSPFLQPASWSKCARRLLDDFQLGVGQRFAAHYDGSVIGAGFRLLSDPTLKQAVHEILFLEERVPEES